MSSSNLMNEKEINLLKSEDPSDRRTAVEDLMGKEPDEATVMVLCSMLADPDKGVRDSASLTLIFNSHPLIPKYVVPLISSPEISIRNLAGEVLLRIGESSINDMAAYIKTANDDDKKFLIDILGLIGNERPVPEIIEVLVNSTNDNVVLSCIEALGNIRYKQALPELISIYEKNELYKPTIIEALGKMDSSDALNFVTSRYFIEDDLTKFSIIESFGNLGNESTFYLLLSELSKLSGPIIWPVIASLCQLKEKLLLDLPFDESIKNSILYTLMEAETKYKRSAASLVTVFDDKDIMDALIHIYGEDPEIDENIKPVFFQYSHLLYSKLTAVIKGKPSNLKNLLWLIKDIIDYDSESINSLSEINKKNLSDAFTLSLDNPDEEVRKSSIELLFVINLNCALVFIDTMIEDDNIWNRLKIVELIENIFTPKTNEILKKLAEDAEEMVRERAIWTLAQRGITNLESKVE